MRLFLFLALLGLSQCQDLSTVRYLLWTRDNENSFQQIYTNDPGSITSSNFDAGRTRTYFAYHGWTSNGETDFIINAKNNILDIQDANFISVDWEQLGDSPLYEPSVNNLYDVAYQTAQLIQNMTQNNGLQTSDIHVWGHSLGAHASGMTGHYVKQLGLSALDRVTGLDPAAPSFENVAADQRIDSTSANFVDIIHSNAGGIIDACVGLEKEVGHLDFYPNGGAHQPGCSDGEGELIDMFQGCSHGRACDYFVESINGGTPFNSALCSSYDDYASGACSCSSDPCQEMGYNANNGQGGSYYCDTNAASPFAQG